MNAKGLKNSPGKIALPKVPQLPGGTQKGAPKNQGPVNAGYGLKHKLRHGTMFPGMDTIDSGVSDQMTDYARMKAAGAQ